MNVVAHVTIPGILSGSDSSSSKLQNDDDAIPVGRPLRWEEDDGDTTTSSEHSCLMLLRTGRHS